MRVFNNNLSLFSALSNNNPMGSFNFSDYSSIKNGSYGKLMKSYYAEQKGTSNKKSTSKTPNKNVANDNSKLQKIDKTGMTQMKKEADGLKNALDTLNKKELWEQTDGKYDIEKITGAVKSFVNEYNDVLDQSAKVNDNDINRSVRYMSSMTGTMSKALSNIGITVGKDGKMTFDEDAMKKARVSSVKSMFYGSVSYGSQIAGRASEISRDTTTELSVYSRNGSLYNSINSMFNTTI